LSPPNLLCRRWRAADPCNGGGSDGRRRRIAAAALGSGGRADRACVGEGGASCAGGFARVRLTRSAVGPTLWPHHLGPNFTLLQPNIWVGLPGNFSPPTTKQCENFPLPTNRARSNGLLTFRRRDNAGHACRRVTQKGCAPHEAAGSSTERAQLLACVVQHGPPAQFHASGFSGRTGHLQFPRRNQPKRSCNDDRYDTWAPFG